MARKRQDIPTFLQEAQDIVDAEQTTAPVLEEPVAVKPEENPIPEVVVAPAPVETTVVIEAPPSESETDSARYKTAQGLLEVSKKEIREARDAKEEADRKAAELKSEVERLSGLVKEQMQSIDVLLTKAQEVPAPVAPVVAPVEELSDADTDLLGGADIVGAIRVIVRQEMQSLRAEFQNEFAPVKTQVQEISVTTAEQKRLDKFHNAFYTLVPDYREIDGSKEFSEWIVGKEDIYGNKYLDLYNEAVTKTLDAKIAAGIQKAFLNNQNAQTAPVTTSEPVVVTAPVVVPVVPAAPAINPALMDQIAPARGSAATGSSAVTAKQVTEEEVLAATKAYTFDIGNRDKKKRYDELTVQYHRQEAEKLTATGKK